jgi:eukaryotic-like serine/threonine-protein kinase
MNSMPARFQEIEQIFFAAVKQQPDQVSAFLDTACEGDAVLQREVEALLASDQRAGPFIEKSAVGLVTKILQNQQADSLVGETIDHYKISESIGTGGMGEVYLATDIVAGRKAALKLLPLRFTGDAGRLTRFQQEARAVVGLNHPNILTVYEIGEDHSIHYIASELIEGETLRQRLARGPMELIEAVDIAIQVASALVAAHQAAIVHRDIKPENIMLRPDGYVKVLDFGIAKLAEEQLPGTMPRDEALLLVETNLGAILGTVRYMSPEQACGERIDKTTDIWSLGVVLYETVTGRAPFTGDTPQEVMSSILEKEPPPLTRYVTSAPAELQQIVSKTLRKDPAQRYHNAHELLNALKNLRRKLEAGLERAAAPLWLRWARSPVALVLMLLATGLALTFPFFRYRSLRPSSPPEKSIAVLPFENASNEPNSEYLSEGISEALINSLSELQQLRVVARPTAFHYKRKDVDPRQVGRELGVAAVLTGKVRQTRDALNVQVDLVDPVTGAEIWGAGYDRKITDLVAVKQAIAQEVTAKLKLKLSSEDQRRLVKRDSTNAEAYQCYLRGRYFWNKRTSDGIKQAIEHFQQSIERDPNFALGYVGLADCYTGLTFYNFAAPHEAMPKAKESAIKALALDDTLAEAHATLAHILINYDWNSPATEKEFKRSIELNPEYATAHQWYAIHYLTATGRLEEAVQEMKKALELEPASLVMNTFMGATLYYAGRYDEAIDQCRRTIQMDPNFAVAHWHLGLAYEQKQLLDAATEEFRKAISLSGGSPLMKAALGRAYAKARKTHEANEILNELNELAKRQYASAYELATIYVALGNNEEAFQLLAKAYMEHSFHLVNLNVSPQFKSVRLDPRFQDLVQRIGLSKSPSNPVAAEKSIAVLPFENLSKDEENAFFAGGVQDEILADLAKIADLKVISRTSVVKYKSDLERNLREIATTLGVSHVVEGSVQRAGDRVRLNVQLIDARNDAHIWGEHYDRDVADVFAIQSEIAQRIADQLRAKLSLSEKAAIAERPTADLVAYAYYTKAKEIDVWKNWEGAEKSMAQKIGLLEKAIQRDPNFALAYCALAKTQVYLAEDPNDYELAKKSAETALRVQPDLGEAHLELARYYWMTANYPRAHEELAIVRRKLPNNAEALWIEAMIGRHENRWDASLANLRKASELDPRNAEMRWDLGRIYFEMHRYSELEQLMTKTAASGGPLEEPWTKMVKAEIKLAQGDAVAAQSLIEQVPPDFSPDALIWVVRFTVALYLRDYDGASRVIAATPAKWANQAFQGQPPESWADGQIARARGDTQKAQAAFAAARKKMEATWGDKPKDASYFADIAKFDAGLGRKEEAIREAQHAVELQPIANDSLNGTGWIDTLALVYAWTGERDQAIGQLAMVAATPGSSQLLGDLVGLNLTYGDLLLNPCWDDLRGDPGFDKIVAAAKAVSR